MFSKTMLLAQVKTTAARITFLLGCIAVLALQGPGVARGQGSDVRTEMLKALELQSSVAESLGRADLAATLDKAIEQVLFMSDADLAPMVGVIDEIQNYGGALQRLDAVIQEAAAAVEAQSTTGTSSVITRSAVPPPSLTAPPYFDGGALGILCRLPDATIGERNDTEVLLLASAAVSTAKVAVGAAKVVWAGVEVACGLDVVAVGTVGVGFAACVIAAVAVAAAEEIQAAAEEILEGFKACDATVDEAHLDAAFFRAEDNYDLGVTIHSDLTTHDANIDGDLVAHNANIDADLAAHDADIKALLATVNNGIVQNKLLLDQVIDLLITPQGRRVGFPLK